MTVDEIIEKLTSICRENGVDPSEVFVHFETATDQHIWEVGSIEMPQDHAIVLKPGNKATECQDHS